MHPHPRPLFVLIVLALLGASAARATLVGLNIDIHQDVTTPLPNDFHLIGLICTPTGVPPALLQTINGRPGSPYQFPMFEYSFEPAGAADPCWMWLHARWFYPPGSAGIPYCQILHLGVLLDVQGDNVFIDAWGYWSLNGSPVGIINPGLRNRGFVPVIGFNVPEVGDPSMRIVNGQPVWLPPPPLPLPLPPPTFITTLKQIDMIAFPAGGAPPLQDLWIGGAQSSWPWVYVADSNGNRIFDSNPLEFWPDSFFDVFLEAPMPPLPPNALRTMSPVVVEPGGFLVSRQRISYVGNNNNTEPNRWLWEIHGAQMSEACCFSNGSCLNLLPAVCMQQGGTPQGPGTNCGNVICPIIGPPACCFGSSCAVMDMLTCQQMGGVFYGYIGCDPNPCPQPTGVCCFGQACEMITEVQCTSAGGQWLGTGLDCFPNPCAPPPEYWLQVQGGIVVEQGGTGYMGEWFLYPNNWWNQWWPNIFALDRQKVVTIEFTIDFPQTAAPPVVAFNFARDSWVASAPPMPLQDQYVVRAPVNPPVMTSGTYTYTMTLPFCPSWVSVDVQGMTFSIQGTIVHECLPPQVVGACCYGPLMQDCAVVTQVVCETQYLGTWQGASTDCFPNPCGPPRDYWLRVSGGVIGEQGGTGYLGEWFLYPNNWWNQWWPNEWALDRQKLVRLDFEVEFPNVLPPPIVAFNFASEEWFNSGAPPMPAQDQYVIRIPADPPIELAGRYTREMLLPFCPLWVSVDVQGYDFAIQGNIEHVCLTPVLGACCAGWDCSLQTQLACSNMHGRYLGDGSDCGPPNPCEIRDVVVCEPQPPTHPNHYWYDVTPGNFGRCDFHVRVYDTDGLNYTNILKPAATWQFAVHQLPNGEWWASWWDPNCQNAIFQTFRFGFDNPHLSTWDGWTTTIGAVSDPYWDQIDNWMHHADEPDGFGYRVHVPSDQMPLGACCYGLVGTLCVVTDESHCGVLGGVWHSGLDCTDADGDSVADVCEPPLGACCFADGTCSELWRFQCLAQGGILWLQGVPCDPNPCPPPNDNCPAAIPVGDVTGLPFDTANATLDGPNHCQMTKNIWYCYTAPCTGWAQIDTCGSSFDTKLAVYHDCYCNPSLPMMMCCDDNGCGLQSVCYVPVHTNHGFLIEIGGAPGSLGGTGVLNIQCFPSGACCFGPNGINCQVTTQRDCFLFLGGTWHQGADCTDLDGDGVADVCEPPLGACCFADGSCQELWQFVCTDSGGTLWLEGVACLPENPCPQPTPGACCWGPDGLRCVETSELMCNIEYQGIWHGAGTTCADLNGDGIADICEPAPGPEACCLPGGVCLMIPRPECVIIDGQPLGAGTYCLGDQNGDGMDDVCDLKWIQPPELRPIGLDVNATLPFDLADDWFCPHEGVITEFTIWGSWFQDVLPGDPMNVMFWLAVHADIPDPDGDGPAYSMPGPILWVHPFQPGTYLAMPYQPALEGWFTLPDQYIFPGDGMCWMYRFKVPQWEGFWQGRNVVADGSVYWLEVQAQVMGSPQPTMFGWKTTWKHWNDDAVWTFGLAPSMGPWQELRYPPPHLLFPRSIDLAFGLHELRICRGDVDCSGRVDFFDIDPFVFALGFGGGVGYPFPHCPWLNADCDGDGDVDFFDIDPFVALLGNVCPP